MKLLQPTYYRSDERGSLTDIRGEWKQANILHIYKGEKFGGHYHKEKTEIFYVMSGLVTFTIVNQEKLYRHLLVAGKIIMVEPYDQHTLLALEDSVVVEFLSSSYDEKDTFKYG